MWIPVDLRFDIPGTTLGRKTYLPLSLQRDSSNWIVLIYVWYLNNYITMLSREGGWDAHFANNVGLQPYAPILILSPTQVQRSVFAISHYMCQLSCSTITNLLVYNVAWAHPYRKSTQMKFALGWMYFPFHITDNLTYKLHIDHLCQDSGQKSIMDSLLKTPGKCLMYNGLNYTLPLCKIQYIAVGTVWRTYRSQVT